MKKAIIILSCLALILAFSTQAMAGKGKYSNCTKIKDGTLLASTGEVIVLGYDYFGYNYQAHMFNGRYCDYDRVLGGSSCDVDLIMKWNDVWMSNKDCNGDGKLDRGYSCDPVNANSSGCPGAWLTNHQAGMVEVNGKTMKWTYFVKIVAAPADAYEEGGKWWTADGTEIGPVIWGAYAVIQEILNDPSTGDHGVLYKSPAGPGFGKFKP